VLCALCLLSLLLHGPSLLAPSRFIFSPADIMGRQPELAGQAAFEPANRLLIDPVLQFEPWDTFTRQQLQQGRTPFWNPYSGAGAPFAGNGQSRLFDPVRRLFLLAPAPWAWAAESAFRFVLTGMGLYTLCRFWQLGRATRVYCALALPLSGFFTLWRLYPLVATASVVPWLWLAFERLWQKPTPARTCLAAAVVAWLVAAGNVQVAAVGLLSLGWLWACSRISAKSFGLIKPSLLAILIGLCLAAPAWVSLADYLVQSPIWADRIAEHTGQGRGSTSRWADLPTLLAPFIYGSERRGDPNFHKALGAGNVNEAASGFTGMVSLVLLIPLALFHKPTRQSPVGRFAIGLWLTGLVVGYRLPPVPWLWPHLPVLQGIDPRRFVVAASLGGTLLAGLGLQSLASLDGSAQAGNRLIRLVLTLALLYSLAAKLPWLVQERLQAQALRHYEQAIAPGPDHAGLVKLRVEGQLTAMLHTWPAYMLGRSCLLFMLMAAWRATAHRPHRRTPAIAMLALLELLHFGWHYNPHVARKWLDQPGQTPLIHRLRQLTATETALGRDTRFLAVGEALPPNQLMRFGLKDLRNYDSIELLPQLAALGPLFEQKPGQDRTSRRPITWDGVARAKAILQSFSVVGVVGLSPPPEGLFDRVEEPLPGVWLGTWPGRPRVEGANVKLETDEPGAIRLRMMNHRPETSTSMEATARHVVIQEMFDPGWRLRGPAAGAWHIGPEPETGLIQLTLRPSLAGVADGGTGELELIYRPRHWVHGLWASALGGLICAGLWAGGLSASSKIRTALFSSPDAPG